MARLIGTNAKGVQISVGNNDWVDTNPYGPFPVSLITLYKALVGDPNDNIKGVPRLGDKTFLKLLATYGIEGLEQLEQLIITRKLHDLNEQSEGDKSLRLIVNAEKTADLLKELNPQLPEPRTDAFRDIIRLVGIAKSTAAEGPEDATSNPWHSFLGTPAYVSPEQVRGGFVDTRSDLYSLGVLLYELLAATTPTDAAEWLKSGIETLRRNMAVVDPPTPSQRVQRLAPPEAASAADARSTTASRWFSALCGDLDAVVMKCLEKDPAHRYLSARELAEDLARWQRGEPIRARPPAPPVQFRAAGLSPAPTRLLPRSSARVRWPRRPRGNQERTTPTRRSSARSCPEGTWPRRS
jgi:serine/threonine protein kinase